MPSRKTFLPDCQIARLPDCQIARLPDFVYPEGVGKNFSSRRPMSSDVMNVTKDAKVTDATLVISVFSFSD